MYHSVYTGSDEQYHYFAWERGLRSGEVKVEKAQLRLSHEFPRGTDTAFITKSPQGKVDVVMPEARSEQGGAGNSHRAGQ